LNKGRIKGWWNNGKQEEKELNITIDNGRARSVKQMAKLIQTLNMHTEKSKFAGTINWCV
jgi:16S rRNA U516 pseudouridylate synthase RsuA-like enzyme